MQLRVTGSGEKHPILAWNEGGVGPSILWPRLPALLGLNRVSAKPGATVLLDAPFSGGAGLPVLVSSEVGQGRVLALMTGTLWRWALTAQAEGRSVNAYQSFWTNALSWLARDSQTRQLTVRPEPREIEPGQTVRVVVGVLDDGYQPASGALASVELVDHRQSGKVVARAEGATGSDGSVVVELPPLPEGAYAVVGRARLGSRDLGPAEAALSVRAVSPERTDMRIGQLLMAEIAAATHGVAQDVSRLRPGEIPIRAARQVEIGRSHEVPLWPRWWVLVVVLGAAVGEWALRRWLGVV